MKRFYVTYAARRVGAIGEFYAVGCSVQAMTEADAKQVAYVRLHIGGYETDRVLRIKEETPVVVETIADRCDDAERRMAAGEPLHAIEESMDACDH